jgi:hypothetical protein
VLLLKVAVARGAKRARKKIASVRIFIFWLTECYKFGVGRIFDIVSLCVRVGFWRKRFAVGTPLVGGSVW